MTSRADERVAVDPTPTPQASARNHRPHHHPAHTVGLSARRSETGPTLTLTEVPPSDPTAGTAVTALHTPPGQLSTLLRRLKTRELHAGDDTVATHHETILAAVRTVASLRRIVLGTMAFDLDDPLDAQLAQLVLVLSAQDPSTPDHPNPTPAERSTCLPVHRDTRRAR